MKNAPIVYERDWMYLIIGNEANNYMYSFGCWFICADCFGAKRLSESGKRTILSVRNNTQSRMQIC